MTRCQRSIAPWILLIAACDGSGENLVDASLEAVCGNGIVEFGEQCDLGAENSDDAAARCSSTCRLPLSDSALTACADDETCTSLRIEGQVLGLPVATVRGEVGEFSTAVATDAAGNYVLDLEVRDPAAPLVLTATSDITAFQAARFISSTGAASAVLTLASNNQVTRAESAFVNITPLSTALHIATSVNGASFSDWNGADRVSSEWQLGAALNSSEVIDLAAIIRLLANTPEQVSLSVESTVDLVGNGDAVNQLLAQFDDSEVLSQERTTLLESLVSSAGGFPAITTDQVLARGDVLSGPIVSPPTLLRLAADGTGGETVGRLSGPLIETELAWAIEDGVLAYTTGPVANERRILSFSDIRIAYADSPDVVEELENLLQAGLVGGTVACPVRLNSLTLSVVAEGLAMRTVIATRSVEVDIAACLNELTGQSFPERTTTRQEQSGLELILDLSNTPSTPVPPLSGQQYILNIYRDTDRESYRAVEDSEDFYFANTTSFRENGTGTAVGPSWVGSTEFTWSVTDDELQLTTAEGGVHTCRWLQVTELMDSVFCRLALSEPDRSFNFIGSAMLKDPVFGFDQVLQTGLTNYWQTTITWLAAQVSGPEELDETSRFGFLFVEDGTFRRLTLSATADSPDTLVAGTPTLFINNEFEQDFTDQEAELSRDFDLARRSFGKCSVAENDPECLQWQRRFWSPVAFRNGFLLVTEFESRLSLDLIGSSYDRDIMEYRDFSGDVIENPLTRFNFIWPRPNAYFFDEVPPWPWVSSGTSACGTFEVPDGQQNDAGQCLPRLFELPVVTSATEDARSVASADFDGNGVNDLIVSYDDAITRFSVGADGVFTASESVAQTCCGGRAESLSTDSTGTGAAEVSFLYAGPTPRIVSCTAAPTLSCTPVALPGDPGDGVEGRRVASLRRNGGETLAILIHDTVQLLDSSPTGYLASDIVPLTDSGFTLGTGDLNNDGFDDIIVSLNNDDVDFLFGDAGGAFTRQASLASSISARVDAIEVADFGGDGRNELLVETDAGILLYPRLTSLGFALPVAFDTDGDRNLVADLSGDSLPDVLSVNPFEAVVLEGSAQSGLASFTLYERGLGGVIDATIGSFDNDPNADLIILNDRGGIELLRGTGLSSTITPPASIVAP
ncbi:MAG: FG-GAP-like repeat-containing protein [Myxococcota bacterium]